MRLLKLSLKNFKGIREFEMVMPEGQTSMSVYGDNEVQHIKKIASTYKKLRLSKYHLKSLSIPIL